MKKLVQARAVHKCTECGKDIFPGDICMSESSRKKYVYLTSYLCKKCTEQLLLKRANDVPVEAGYTPNSEIVAKYMELPKDRNGKPIHVGDKVHPEFGNPQEVIVYAIDDDSCIFNDDVWNYSLASNCEIVEPPKQLTKEDIDAMAKIDTYDYWKCRNTSRCSNCPSKINGKLPREYYGVNQCYEAQILDMLRLERERTAGEQA